MKRVDADEHSSNQFQDQNLPTTQGTLIEETWLNSVQEELAQSIERSGQAIDASTYRQLQRSMLRHGPAVNMWTGTGGHYGEWHPQDPTTNNQTFWVDYSTTLTGEVTAGTIWLRNLNGILKQHNWSSDELIALGLSSKVFTASKDTYLQVDTDSNISFVETALGAGEPAPTGTNRNAIKIVTDATQITDVYALAQAWPDVRAGSLLLTDIELEDRSTATEEGFRLEMILNGGASGDNLLRWQPWETSATRAYFLEIDDVKAGGTHSKVTWRGSAIYLETDDGVSNDGADGTGPVRMRTYDGSTAQNTRYVDDVTFAYNHSTGEANETIATYPISSAHDGAHVLFMVSAVDAADASRCFAGIESYLIRKDDGGGGSDGTQLFAHSADPESTGVTTSMNTTVDSVQIMFKGETGKTWRVNGWAKIVPFDVTA